MRISRLLVYKTICFKNLLIDLRCIFTHTHTHINVGIFCVSIYYQYHLFEIPTGRPTTCTAAAAPSVDRHLIQDLTGVQSRGFYTRLMDGRLYIGHSGYNFKHLYYTYTVNNTFGPEVLP